MLKTKSFFYIQLSLVCVAKMYPIETYPSGDSLTSKPRKKEHLEPNYM